MWCDLSILTFLCGGGLLGGFGWAQVGHRLVIFIIFLSLVVVLFALVVDSVVVGVVFGWCSFGC